MKIVYKQCLLCKKEFATYQYKNNKYCSKKCYLTIIGKSNKGIKQSLEWIEKLRKTRTGRKWNEKQRMIIGEIMKKGETHPRYIKDRTQLKRNGGRRRDSAYCYWRIDVYKRDKWKCKLLSSECKGRLESHHIFNWVDYPELRYVINNGITLCHFHHPLKWEEEKRMIPIFQELLSVSKE